jgi:hypothetical protein
MNTLIKTLHLSILILNLHMTDAMNIKIAIVTILSLTLVISAATTLQRLQIAYAIGATCSGCAKDFAPGTEAKSPGDAQNLAPGQEASIGPIPCNGCAKDFAPGQEKIITK